MAHALQGLRRRSADLVEPAHAAVLVPHPLAGQLSRRPARGVLSGPGTQACGQLALQDRQGGARRQEGPTGRPATRARPVIWERP